MKKSLALVLFALISMTAYSQVSWNAKAGLNLSNVTNAGDTGVKPGFQLGVGMEYQLSEMFFLQPSLMLSTKGYKVKNTEITSNRMYVELPVMAAVRFAVTEYGQNVVIKAGPYAAYGVGGKTKVGSTSWNSFEKNTGAKRFDFGLGCGVAYEINQFFVDLTGEVGLANTLGSSKNINFALGVGYKF